MADKSNVITNSSGLKFSPLGPNNSGEKAVETPLKFTPLYEKKTKDISVDSDGLPEITSQKAIPWHQRLGTDLKLTFTSEPWEKARIIAKSFPNRVELFQDVKNKQPVISLDGKHFSVNKKGMSAADLQNFVAETGFYLIPSILSGGATLLGRLGLGALTYGAAEGVRQVGTGLFGGKGQTDKEMISTYVSPIDSKKVGATAAMGGLTEAFLPPVLKIGGKALRKIWSSGKQNVAGLNAVINAAAAGDEVGLQKALELVRGGSGSSPIEATLTKGQRSGNKALLETESMMREGTGAYGEGATKVIQGADARQMRVIEDEALKLQGKVGAGSGFNPQVPAAIGGSLQDSLRKIEAKTQAAAAAKMEAGRTAMNEAPAFITGGTLFRGIDTMLKIPASRGIRGDLLRDMPSANVVLGRLRRTRNNLKNGRISIVDFKNIEAFRKSLGKRIDNLNTTAGKEERALLLEMKTTLDNSIDDALTKGLMHGDKATIQMVKEGRAMWADYMKKFFPRQKDRFGQIDLAGNKLQKILSGETPENVVNFFVNVTRAGPKRETLELFDRMKNIFGEGSEQIALIKDAVIYRMFTNAQLKGKGDITRTSIVKNYFDFFNKNSSLANKMFSLEEREMIRQFVGQVSRTIPAEMRMNPSGTGMVIARLLRDVGSGGLVARIGSLVKGVPIVGDMGGQGYAKTLAYVNRLTSAPWGAAVVAGTDRGDNSVPQKAVTNTANTINRLLP
mgnify:CR=1 FL=1